MATKVRPGGDRDPASIRAAIARYLSTQPPAARKALVAMRSAIRAAAPDAVEIFSYGIPGFRLDGKPLAWYAGFARHTSLYPMGAAIRRRYASALEGYATSTGTIRFPLDRQPPASLVRTLVMARISEIRRGRERGKSRTGRTGGKRRTSEKREKSGTGRKGA